MAGSVGVLSKGDVVVVPFPFSNQSDSKKRPALVVSQSSNQDVIICAITSKSHPDELQIQLEDRDFKFGNLALSPCYIRPDVIVTVSTEIITKKVGYLKDQKIEEVIAAILGVFQRPAVPSVTQSKALVRGQRQS